MAGVYAILRQGTNDRLDAVAPALRFGGEAERRIVEGGFACVWLGHDDPERFAPARDPATGVWLVAGGRVCWSAAELRGAAGLSYEGGTANRLLLKRYLERGVEGVAPYNGAAAILVWDPRGQTVHLWTDQMGYHPAFLHDADGAGAAFTTFPDALRHDPAVRLTPDELSMAEFLRSWRTTPPHTYWEEVRHAGAATRHDWRLEQRAHVRTEYWRPFEQPPFGSLGEAGEALAAAVGSAIRERTEHGDRCAFFVSGGADSRMLLYGAADPARVLGINLYERPTFESSVAKSLCERAGAEYLGFQRDPDYYPRLLPEHARWSGAMWCVEDGHYLGVRDAALAAGAGLAMTACTVDWVFKGYGLEYEHRMFLGKPLPLKRLTRRRIDAFLPNYPGPAPARWEAGMRERFAAWFAGTPTEFRTPQDWLRVEDRRIRPTCYTVSVSGQIMYRAYPYDTFLADARVADCYARILPEWKVNGGVWGQAAARLCAKAGDIVDSNYGWKVDDGEAARLWAFARGWAKRKWAKARPQAPAPDDGRPPSNASWPEMGWYARHSPTLRRQWDAATPDDRARMAGLLGADPWAEPLAAWADRAPELFRIMTLLAHWRGAGR